MTSKIAPFPIRKILLLVLSGLSSILAACSDEPKPAPPVQLLATDVYVMIGGTRLTLPFAALEDYAYRQMSFSLSRQGDGKPANDAVDDLVDSARSSVNPLVLSDLSIVVRAYGWNDFDMRQREMCPLLNRTWAQSVCDNPWDAIRQALPADRFKLVDLRLLSGEGADRLLNCVEGSQPQRSIPIAPGETVLVCRAAVYPLSGNVFQKAVVRLDRDLGALWTVWGNGQNGESAEDMAHREGKAIVSFVRNAIGSSENFPELRKDTCGLRRPGSVDSSKGPYC